MLHSENHWNLINVIHYLVVAILIPNLANLSFSMFEVNLTQYIVDKNFILKVLNANMMVNSLIIQPH